VIERLKHSWPGLEVIVEQIHTRGDLNTEASLRQIGGDGVFVTEIERALRDGRIDLAVHSLKDLPTAQPPGLRIAVVGPREDVRDVMVSGAGERISAQDFQAQLSRIAEPLRIGTGSLRRIAQLRRLSPDAQILPIRGNVDTRLRKLDVGDYDAIVLAAAGLHRLALSSRLAGRVSYFPINTLMPAPGQGALALEMRDDPQMRDLTIPLINREAQAATTAERMFMRRLGAGCYLPVAAYGEITGSMLVLRGLVISLDGRRAVRVQQSIPWTLQTSLERAEQLGISLAEEALARGADEIIAGLDAALPDARSGDVRSADARCADARSVDAHTPDATPPDAHKGHPYILGFPHPTGVMVGTRVLVTRAGEQAGALSERLRELGAIAIEFPVIRIVPPEDMQPLDDALGRLCQPGKACYTWVVFTSANGVNRFFERLRELGGDAQALQGVRVAVIGAATRAALERYGVRADVVPGEFVAERLVEALIEDARRRGETLAGKRVLLARAADARDVVPISLREAGVLVDDVAVYRTIPAAGDDATGREVLRLLQERRLDMLTFTSSSTVRNFVHWLDRVLSGSVLAASKIACIGPVTAQTARELGLHVDIEAQDSTIDGLIEAIRRYEEH
jgi:hydroxymethylbilane synthase